jgi:hypothetical protein
VRRLPRRSPKGEGGPVAEPCGSASQPTPDNAGGLYLIRSFGWRTGLTLQTSQV